MPYALKRFPHVVLQNCLVGLAFFCAQLSSSAQAPSVALVVPEQEQVENFDLVGNFRVVKTVKVLQGDVVNSTPAEITLRVFSNNQELKIYHSQVDDSYQLFTIYRDDGITALDLNGDLSIRPGLQARLTTKQTTKHLSLSGDTLVITEFPPITDTVVITTATRTQ